MLEQWYWILPNVVLFSSDLTDKQKLLYCLISSLCAEKWFCWATNEYLWEILWVKEWTISTSISKLKNIGFIDYTIENNNKRKISLVKNHMGVCEKSQGGVCEKSQHINTIYNNTIEYIFSDFWKDYPHARKWKKWESERYFKQQPCDEVKKQVSIMKWKLKAWLIESKYIPACERWIRDFTPINDDVIKQDLYKICKWHLNAWWDMKQRSQELKETFGEQQINEIVKAIQQKDSPKNLFLKQS